MTRLALTLAALALSACASPEANCAAAQALALGLDVGGSWAAEAHYADAAEICGATALNRLAL